MDKKKSTEGEESLVTSPKNENKPITQEPKKLTKSQTLEILTQSFFMAQEDGIELEVLDADNNTTVIIHNVKLVGGILVPVD